MPSDAYEIAFVRGFCESLAKRIGELEERVTALDDPVARHVVRGFPDNEWGVSRGLKPSPTDSGRIVVDANEFERLQRIEKAASKFMVWVGTDYTLRNRPAAVEMYWALEQKPVEKKR